MLLIILILDSSLSYCILTLLSVAQHQGDAGSSGESVVDFVSKGFSKDSNPHPLFDSEYYLAQLPGVQWLNITLSRTLCSGRCRCRP